MEQIYIFTAAASEAREHLRVSIQQPIDLDTALQFFRAEKHAEIQEIHQTHGLYAWGAVPGQRNGPTWESMQADDWVLCVFDSRYRYVAQVAAKFDNEQLARQLWGSDESGTTWQLMYCLTKPQAVDVPLDDVADYLNRRYMGFTRISDDRVQQIAQAFGSVQEFVSQRLFHYNLSSAGAAEDHPLERITRDDVLEALGRIARNEGHGYGPSTAYDLLHEGMRYPPKAAAGLATARTLGRALRPDEFSGGVESRCFRVLRRLGFEIVKKEEQAAMDHFIIRSNVDAHYADRVGEIYHYSANVPNHRRIREGANVIVDQRGPSGTIRLLGYGVLGQAQPVEGVADPAEFNSPFVEWTPFDPPRRMTEELLGMLRQQDRYNVQHSIRGISQDLFNRIVEGRDGQAELPLIQAEQEAPYSIDDACADLFMDTAELNRLLDLFRRKKNLILQGAPGTGKSYLAKRLGYALMGAKAPNRIQMI